MDDILRPDDELIKEILVENLHKILKNVEKSRNIHHRQRELCLKIGDYDGVREVEKGLIELQKEQEKAEEWLRVYG